MEDPSEEFVRLRDFVDTRNCLEMVEAFRDADKVKAGFSEAMIKESNEKLKLCKRQVRRIYEIVRLHWTKKTTALSDSPNSKEYKNYRVAVKKILNIPFQVMLLFLLL